jgi:hypothetical protein
MRLINLVERVITEAVNKRSVINAIKQRKRITFNYDGKATRFVDPKVLGYTTAGNMVIRGYQYDGYTETINPQWKLFLLDKMSNLKITNQEQQDYEGYNESGDKSMSEILVHQGEVKQAEIQDPNLEDDSEFGNSFK